ncbi:MAG: AAA family ATPase [Gammaproteobacteria bacterium]|nr:AAA family ATPase [Gammaproteobacteria bacterium]
MRKILVLNAKGGSGKTTVATNLAGYFASEGHRVALADMDPQGSSLDWLEVRGDKYAPIKGINAVDRLRVPGDIDWLIMDAPSRAHGDYLTTLVRRAETIIMPVVPSPLDIRAAGRFLDELRSLRNVIENDVKLATVGSRAREGTRVANDLEDYLFDLRLPNGRKFPFLTVLRQSQNYIRAAERGASIFEFAPFTTLYDREQWRPLTRWLESPRSEPEG